MKNRQKSLKNEKNLILYNNYIQVAALFKVIFNKWDN